MLRRDALHLLACDFDHSLLNRRRRTLVTAIDLNSVDLDSEIGLLATVTGPRIHRGYALESDADLVYPQAAMRYRLASLAKLWLEIHE